MDFILNLKNALVDLYRKFVSRMAYKSILKKLENEGLSDSEFEIIKDLEKNWRLSRKA